MRKPRKMQGVYGVITTTFDKKRKPISHFIECIGPYLECRKFFKDRYIEDNVWRVRRIYKMTDISQSVKLNPIGKRRDYGDGFLSL